MSLTKKSYNGQHESHNSQGSRNISGESSAIYKRPSKMIAEGSEHIFSLKAYDNRQYQYYEEGRFIYEACTPSSTTGIACRPDLENNSAGKVYFTENRYLISSNPDGSAAAIAAKLDTNGRVVATDKGVFVIATKQKSTQIDWYKGSNKEMVKYKTISLDGIIRSTYLCGNLLFYRKQIPTIPNVKLDTPCSAYCMDMETEKTITLLEGKLSRPNRNRSYNYESNYVSCDVQSLFGNEHIAVMQVEIFYNSKTLSVHSKEWLYYDFDVEVLRTLSSKRVNHPLEAFSVPERYDEIIRQLKRERKPRSICFYDIVAFDIQESLMWVAVEKNGALYFVPANITNEKDKLSRPDLRAWKVGPFNDIDIINRKNYFNGKLFISTEQRLKGSNYSNNLVVLQQSERPIFIENLTVKEGSFCNTGDSIFINGESPSSNFYGLRRYSIPFTPTVLEQYNLSNNPFEKNNLRKLEEKYKSRLNHSNGNSSLENGFNASENAADFTDFGQEDDFFSSDNFFF